MKITKQEDGSININLTEHEYYLISSRMLRMANTYMALTVAGAVEDARTDSNFVGTTLVGELCTTAAEICTGGVPTDQEVEEMIPSCEEIFRKRTAEEIFRKRTAAAKARMGEDAFEEMLAKRMRLSE